MTAYDNTFTDLITSEHQDKPKFVQTVAFSCQGFADLVNLCERAYKYYDLDTATGTQLDAVGMWVGLSRYVALDIEAFFSWDTEKLGWDEGIWWEIGNAKNQIAKLSDNIYRTFIKLKIACNHWDGTLPGAINIINYAIEPNGYIADIEENNMSVTFLIKGSVSKICRSMIENNYLPLKPAGVNVIYKFEENQ